MPKPGSRLPGFSFLPLWALAGSRDVNPSRNLRVPVFAIAASFKNALRKLNRYDLAIYQRSSGTRAGTGGDVARVAAGEGSDAAGGGEELNRVGLFRRWNPQRDV